MKTTTPMRWSGYVVTSSEGTVFATFGPALKAEAEAYADKQNSSGRSGWARWYVDFVARAKKPVIGTRLS